MRILCYKSFLQKLAMDHICRDCTSMYRCSSKKNKNSIYIFSVSLLTGDVPNWPGTFFLEICQANEISPKNSSLKRDLIRNLQPIILLLEVKLLYELTCQSVGWLVSRSVCLSLWQGSFIMLLSEHLFLYRLLHNQLDNNSNT